MEVKPTINCSWKLKSFRRHDFTRVGTRGVGIERQGRERDSRGVVFNNENYFWWVDAGGKNVFAMREAFFGMESPSALQRSFLSREIKFRSSDLQKWTALPPNSWSVGANMKLIELDAERKEGCVELG